MRANDPRDEQSGGDLYDHEVELLFENHAGRLTDFLLHWRGAEVPLVDKIVLDAFLATRQDWPAVRNSNCPEAYVYKVAIQRMRRLQRSTVRLDEVSTSAGAGTEVADTHWSIPVPTALARLPRYQRQVVWLSYRCGFTPRDIASMLSISETTVKIHSHCARRRLAELLGTDPR